MAAERKSPEGDRRGKAIKRSAHQALAFPRRFTVPDLVRQHAGSRATALVDGDERISYDGLLATSRRFAALLARRGLRRGDRVPLFLRRSARSVACLFGTFLAGGVAIVVNERLRPRQVEHIVEHAGASQLISERSLLRSVRDLRLPDDSVIDLDTVELPDEHPADVPVVSTDLAMLVYTSGSTGLAKGIMLSHANVVQGAATVSTYLQLTSADRLISLLPFSFDYGLNQLTTAMLVGARLVIQRSAFPADICRTLRSERITGMASVPMQWSQLAQSYSPFLGMPLPDLRYMTNTGGHWPESLIARLREAHPHVDIVPMYGLTEAFRSTYRPPDRVADKPGSIGIPVPDVEILVIDEKGQPCAPGEVGELVHRGAHVSLGYWKDRESTAGVFRPNPLVPNENGLPEIVVHSGDLVRRDEEGFLYFVGRRDQLIKSMGFRVSPEEIEHYVTTSGLVAHVAAFAVPVGDVETRIVAAVTPAADAGWDEAALTAHCRREMPEFMRPDELWRVDEFPRTTSGKPDRRRLREVYLESC